jgi:hypothetical protein
VIEDQPKRGVNEARFALTLLTCLLVAIGYVVLLRFGGVKHTTFEAGADDPSAQVGASPNLPKNQELMPQVLSVETPDDHVSRMSQRPQGTLPPHQPGAPERR